jgi:hypothetical protein
VQRESATIEAIVRVAHLDVYDKPDDHAFRTSRLDQGDRVRVRGQRPSPSGWLAIEPPATEFCWIEQSSLEYEETDADDPWSSSRERRDGVGASQERAWVRTLSAVLRSGSPQARIPGPPAGRLSEGTMVRLVDRAPLTVGQGRKQSRWVAIIPPAEHVSYIHAAEVDWAAPTPLVEPAAEVRASYEETVPARAQGQPSATRPPEKWPADLTPELERVDGIYHVIVTSQPPAQWRFETVRTGYQSLLKRVGGRADIEDALRTRLARVTQSEQAARAARTIETILARSHERDRRVDQIRNDLGRSERTRARTFDAIGFIQPSARKVDGHKLFTLIGTQGSTIAYLDIPPGLDPQPLLARRVGIRGRAHFSEDLGTRLISVRDMESLEARR